MWPDSDYNTFTAIVDLSCLLCHQLLHYAAFVAQCGPRSDCSIGSSMNWVHTVCMQVSNLLIVAAHGTSKWYYQPCFGLVLKVLNLQNILLIPEKCYCQIVKTKSIPVACVLGFKAFAMRLPSSLATAYLAS